MPNQKDVPSCQILGPLCGRGLELVGEEDQGCEERERPLSRSAGQQGGASSCTQTPLLQEAPRCLCIFSPTSVIMQVVAVCLWTASSVRGPRFPCRRFPGRTQDRPTAPLGEAWLMVSVVWPRCHLATFPKVQGQCQNVLRGSHPECFAGRSR